MTAGFPLIKIVLMLLAKSVLLPFGLSADIATDAAIQKKCWLGTTALIISNEEMEDIMKMFKSREQSGLLIKGISETIKWGKRTKKKKQKKRIPASILGNALVGERKIRTNEGVIKPSFNTASSFN